MKVVTETDLRRCFREAMPEAFVLEEGSIITPAAREFLMDNRIELTRVAKNRVPHAAGKNNSKPIDQAHAITLQRKPEEMTQLHGNTLVRKDHLRIQLRGRLDSLQSDILLLHARIRVSSGELAADLIDLLGWAREILRTEVLGSPLSTLKLHGLTAAELRERSHNSKKYFGIGHVLPDVNMTMEVLELNKLRSTVREIELVAVAALADGDHPAAGEIIEALNRMSSAVYVLMLTCISQDL